MTTKELIRAEIRKWQSNIEAKCPESTSSRDYTKEEWNSIYEYNAYTRILSFLDTLPDEPVSDCHDFKEAAEKSWVDYEYREDPRGLYSSCYIDGFRAGAEWQKQKMMEGAVEGVVNHGTAVSYVISDEDQLDKRLKQFQNDAEVRIIILPKED